jgi:acetyl-CoA C-acetyltransferase
MALDGLTDAFDHLSMGESTENSGRKLGITRAEQDEFAARATSAPPRRPRTACSPPRSSASQVPQRGGEPLIVTQDEGIRPDTTARVAGQAAAGLRQGRHDHRRHRVADLRRRRRRGGDVGGSGGGRGPASTVLAEIGAHGNVAGPDNSLHSQPSNAIKQALPRPG